MNDTTQYVVEFVLCPDCRILRGPEEWTNATGHCDDCEYHRVERQQEAIDAANSFDEWLGEP